MTEREEQAIIVLNTLHDNSLLSDIHRQALEVGVMAIKALQLQPCEDTISRREAIKMFTYNYKGERIQDYDCDNFPVQIAMKTVKEMLRELPSVKPVEKVGHWIETKKSWMLYKWECSECKTSERFKYNYCPSCGSRMIQEDER